MAFEVFQKSSAPVSKVPTVTIQRRGLMSMNRAAHALIGSPEHVELLWDGERCLIGFRPAEAENPNAYPARPQTVKSDKGPILIAGSLFTRHYDIPTEESMRWVVEVQDGMLILDLNKPAQKATSNRTAAADKAAATSG